MKNPSSPVGRIIPTLLATGLLGVFPAFSQDFLLASSPSGNTFTQAPEHPPLSLGGFDIVVNPGSTLSANPAALAAFNRAAAQWEAYISDPIIVTIDADLGVLGAGVIGSASSVVLVGSYNTIRNQIVADAVNEGSDDMITAFLPTAAQFTALLSPGTSLSGNLSGNKAALKAVGFIGLDEGFGASDGSITFNSTFTFDYNNSDGVSLGMIDFETVAAHEIGHALGFVSSVDDADEGATILIPTMLDLFRFRDGSSSDPTTTSEFTLNARDLTAGTAAIFDDLGNEWLLSTGVNLGDGRQASHWKADELTGTNIGVMDPTLTLGSIFTVGPADLRVLDLIGYEIVSVPEPSALLLTAILGTCIFVRRKRRN